MKAPFLSLAEALDRVRGVPGKKEKVRILSEYLSGLSPEEAEVAARIATGRTSERGSADEVQVGYSTLLEVLKDITGAGGKKVSEAYLRYGDLGEVAEELLSEKKAQTLFDEPLTLGDVDQAFDQLRNAKGQGSALTRKGVVKSLLLRASPLEGRYIVKMFTSEMRTGVVAGLLEDAVAAAFGASTEDVKRAHMILGDVGLLARTAAEGKASEVKVRPFRPPNFMLAEPMASAAEIVSHFGKRVYAERKYDGVRAQVHKEGKTVRVYSRRLEEITKFFPEVVASFASSKGSFILDGEILAFSEGKPLPFQLLQRRLRRIEAFEEAAKNAPVKFFCFDILYLDGEETVGFPLSKRRTLLRRVVSGSGAEVTSSEDVSTEGDVEASFRRSRDEGYEGLVIKDPDSLYTMGRRGSGWTKLKEELDTLDVVVVAAEYGHGKRAGVISDYTFAVRDGDVLKVVGKAYSGLSDKEIDDMTGRLKELTVEDLGYMRTVRPEIVLEVAFDSIQKSGRHDSGYALRFPRIKRVRTDKSVEQIDTIERVEAIFSGQKLKVEG